MLESTTKNQKGDWEGGACVDERESRKYGDAEGKEEFQGGCWPCNQQGQRLPKSFRRHQKRMMDLATWRSKETLMRAVSVESWGWNLFEQVDEKMGDDWRSDHRQCFQGGLQWRGAEKQESNQNDFLFCFLKQKTLEQVSFLIVVIRKRSPGWCKRIMILKSWQDFPGSPA